MFSTEFFDELTKQAETDGVRQFVAGAIVCDENTVLLLKRPSDDFMGGIYELPSGKSRPVSGSMRR